MVWGPERAAWVGPPYGRYWSEAAAQSQSAAHCSAGLVTSLLRCQPCEIFLSPCCCGSPLQVIYSGYGNPTQSQPATNAQISLPSNVWQVEAKQWAGRAGPARTIRTSWRKHSSTHSTTINKQSQVGLSIKNNRWTIVHSKFLSEYLNHSIKIKFCGSGLIYKRSPARQLDLVRRGAVNQNYFVAPTRISNSKNPSQIFT